MKSIAIASMLMKQSQCSNSHVRPNHNVKGSMKRIAQSNVKIWPELRFKCIGTPTQEECSQSQRDVARCAQKQDSIQQE